MSALQEAATARHGVTLAAWEEALRAHVQALLVTQMLRLSEGIPDMLADDGGKYHRIDVPLLLPAGERLRLVASIEVME
jgi:hypothetical protein